MARRFPAAVAVAASLTLGTLGAPTWSTLPQLDQIKAEISAAVSINKLPTSLQPALGVYQGGLSYPAEYGGQQNCGATDSTDITSETPCVFGDVTATRSVVVVGDSEANVWMPTMDSWGQSQGWKIYRIVKLGCEPWEDDTDPSWSNCQKFKAFEVKTILSLAPQIVIATGMEVDNQNGAIKASSSSIAKAIEGFATEIRPTHAKVFVLQNLPWFFAEGPPPSCLASYPNKVKKCDQPRSKVVSATMGDALAAAAKTGLVTELLTDALFCTSSTCPVIVGDFNLYADTHHFQEPWGRHIAKAFGQLIAPSLPKDS